MVSFDLCCKLNCVSGSVLDIPCLQRDSSGEDMALINKLGALELENQQLKKVMEKFDLFP